MAVASLADLAAHLRAFAEIHAARRDGDAQPAVRDRSRVYAAGYERALAAAERAAPASVSCAELDWWQRILAGCRDLIARETRETPPEDWTPLDRSTEEQPTP